MAISPSSAAPSAVPTPSRGRRRCWARRSTSCAGNGNRRNRDRYPLAAEETGHGLGGGRAQMAWRLPGMPRELIAVAPRTPELREYPEPPLGPRQIRIRTEFASPKHGTELVAYRDDPAAHRPYDRAWG